MTSVFLVLITRPLAVQKDEKMDTSFYSEAGEGANKTKSSANASINKFTLAIVNSLHYDLVKLF